MTVCELKITSLGMASTFQVMSALEIVLWTLYVRTSLRYIIIKLHF